MSHVSARAAATMSATLGYSTIAMVTPSFAASARARSTATPRTSAVAESFTASTGLPTFRATRNTPVAATFTASVCAFAAPAPDKSHVVWIAKPAMSVPRRRTRRKVEMRSTSMFFSLLVCGSACCIRLREREGRSGRTGLLWSVNVCALSPYGSFPSSSARIADMSCGHGEARGLAISK